MEQIERLFPRYDNQGKNIIYSSCVHKMFTYVFRLYEKIAIVHFFCCFKRMGLIVTYHKNLSFGHSDTLIVHMVYAVAGDNIYKLDEIMAMGVIYLALIPSSLSNAKGKIAICKICASKNFQNSFLLLFFVSVRKLFTNIATIDNFV